MNVEIFSWATSFDDTEAICYANLGSDEVACYGAVEDSLVRHDRLG